MTRRRKSRVWCLLGSITAIFALVSCRSSCGDIRCGAEVVFVGELDSTESRVRVELCRNGSCGDGLVENAGCSSVHSDLEATACLTGGSALSVELFLESSGQSAVDGDDYTLRVTDPESGTELVTVDTSVTHEAVLPNGLDCPKRLCLSAVVDF